MLGRLVAVLGHLQALVGLCWAAWGFSAASESYVRPFGSRIGTTLGSLGLSWQHLKAVLGHLESILVPFWAAWGPDGCF